MVAEALKEAVRLIKAGKMVEARSILEPIIIANPKDIQAWVWEIETRDTDAEKIKIMEACLAHNPDAAMIQKALAAMQNRPQTLPSTEIMTSPDVFTAEQQAAPSPFSTDKTPEITADVDATIPHNEEDRSQSRVSPFIGGAEEVIPKPIDENRFSQAPFQEMRGAADEGEKRKGKTDETEEDNCPFCGAQVQLGARYCEACGRDLPEEKVKHERVPGKKWYRRTWVKIVLFIFLMPVWSVIELSDPDSKTGVKILAGIVMGFFVNLCGLVLYWILTTNSTKANLLNWYQYLTGKSESAPGTFVRVEGNIQSQNDTQFSLVELQAKVYDKDGNLLGSSSRYLDASALQPGVPTRYQMDVTSLDSALNNRLLDHKLLLFNDFSSPDERWKAASSEEGETAYLDGQYRLTVNAANYDLWSNPGVSYADTKIDVDAAKISGPESNRFGIQCRYSDPDNYYFAVISSDGYYGIGKVVEGTQTFLPEDGMQVTDKIFTGSAINHIRFDCVGSRLTLYVNDDYVDEVDDSDLTKGDIGLMAGNFEKTGTVIGFDNLVVLSP